MRGAAAKCRDVPNPDVIAIVSQPSLNWSEPTSPELPLKPNIARRHLPVSGGQQRKKSARGQTIGSTPNLSGKAKSKYTLPTDSKMQSSTDVRKTALLRC